VGDLTKPNDLRRFTVCINRIRSASYRGPKAVGAGWTAAAETASSIPAVRLYVLAACGSGTTTTSDTSAEIAAGEAATEIHAKAAASRAAIRALGASEGYDFPTA